jgi:protein-S-isoprenylcysteine O-methyltransferase Ste14
MQKLMPTSYLLIGILSSIVLHFIFPVTYIINPPWHLTGLLPILFGIGINISADRAFKKVKTTVKPFVKSSALIQDGVFKLSRNPMYLGFVAILIGIAILLRSLSPFFMLVLFAILMEFIFIRSEERMLQEEFGDVWEQYRLRVRKWI